MIREYTDTIHSLSPDDDRMMVVFSHLRGSFWMWPDQEELNQLMRRCLHNAVTVTVWYEMNTGEISDAKEDEVI